MFAPALSDRIQAIVDKATTKDPAKRFQSAEEFQQALNYVNPSLATTLSQTSPGPSSSYTPFTPTGPSNPSAQNRRDRNNTLLYAILSVLIISSFLVIFYEINRWGSGGANQGEAGTVIRNQRENAITEDDYGYEEYLEEDEPEEEKELTPEEELLDSLRNAKRRLVDFIDLLQKDRRQNLMRNLIVDGQLVNDELGQFDINVVVSNRSEDVRFEDITIAVTYYDDNDKVIKVAERALEPMPPGKTIQFPVTENISAAKFTTTVQLANPVDLDAPPTLDSLQTELELIDERIDRVREDIADRRRDE
ncbi:MAG: hypothetical protein HC880_02310 [Bacteroidia bacterium]|nr:hypothetical protein [Bacteroidia bacterium]